MTASPGSLARTALPLVAILAFVAIVAASLLASVGAGTLGFDFLAYHLAAGRLIEGDPLYDLSFTGAGSFGLFYYPPSFIPLVLPFAFLPEATAAWLWTGLLLGAFLAGVALLPVSSTVRWIVILLAAIDWPFIYALKLGQVGPLLFLGFAVGWRYLDRPVAVGISAAIGAAIKIQPGLVLVWALAMRRWRAVAIGSMALVVIGMLATAVAGLGSWADYRTLLGQVTDPIATTNNLTPGAIAYQLGVEETAAMAIQVTGWFFAAGSIVYGVWRATPVAGYLVTVAASQLISPILWDHYAMLLLLPVAWLLDRGARWAVLVPMATTILLLEVIPPAIYPVVFVVTILATLWSGRRSVALVR